MEYKVSTTVKVRFADLDLLGHVNNAVFFSYMEQARVAYFQKIPDLDFSRIQGEPKTSVILASIQCDFLTPAYLDEKIDVGIRISKLGNSSIVMEYEMKEAASGRRIATGQSTLVYFDYSQQKSLPIPDTLRRKFSEIEGRSLN